MTNKQKWNKTPTKQKTKQTKTETKQKIKKKFPHKQIFTMYSQILMLSGISEMTCGFPHYQI